MVEESDHEPVPCVERAAALPLPCRQPRTSLVPENEARTASIDNGFYI